MKKVRAEIVAEVFETMGWWLIATLGPDQSPAHYLNDKP